MTLINSRASWGARHADGDKDLYGLAEAVVVHHTVTHGGKRTLAAERAHMRHLESIGQSRFGTGISYNVVIFPSGRAYQGVSFSRRGTHTGGHNSTVRSLCFVGNFEDDQPTAAALATAKAIYAEGRGDLWERDAPLKGHRDYSETACPGRNLYARLDDIESGAPPATPVSNPKPRPPAAGLKVDGFWGSSTTRQLQRVLDTPVDGEVSSQSRAWQADNPGLTTGWQWVADPEGSQVIAALQARIGMPERDRDGLIGPGTIRDLQRHLGTPVDGVISRESRAVMALQKRLNDNRI